MKTLIWLDDIRDPLKNNWLVFSPIDQPFNLVWLKTFDEFAGYITANGLPGGICFDHDLSDFQAMKSGYPEMMEDVDWPEHEKTGYDCAKWLVEYCTDNNLALPLYNIQSANEVGKKNIDMFLNNFKKHVRA